MPLSSRSERIVLFIGDVLILFLSLILTLVLRYGGWPNQDLINDHLVPFLVVFCASEIIFLIAGLYEKQTLITKKRLPRTLLNAQLANTVVAVLFFYFIPYFGIAPKTNLFIYLVLSSLLILIWRLGGSSLFSSRKRQPALLVGSGHEAEELFKEVNGNSRYPMTFIDFIHAIPDKASFQREINEKVKTGGVSSMVIDLRNPHVDPLIPSLYELMFSHVTFVELDELYEEIFDRIPLSVVDHGWFLEKISLAPKIAYDFFKRLMDIGIASVLGVVSLIIYPFAYIAVKLDDGGPLFIIQERVGQNNKLIRIVKMRTMKASDSGKWVDREGDNRITRVGKVLRKSRADELPQLWNVLKGDMSLIGPRPDIHGLYVQLNKDLPYYSIRNTIKPGLSGWAQIKQDVPPQSLEETKLRLAYDFYYIKNRSFALDVQIALRTIRTLVSRLGV